MSLYRIFIWLMILHSGAESAYKIYRASKGTHQLEVTPGPSAFSAVFFALIGVCFYLLLEVVP